MNAEDFDSKTVKMLAEIGFIAVSYGLAEHAEFIFKAFQVMRPDQEAGPLGLSLASMVRGNVDDALAHLEAAPPTDTIQTYRGLALLRKGDLETACEILTEVCEMAAGTPCAEIAAQALSTKDELASPMNAMVSR
ncbi:hypothetical protein [Pseudovibrio sp. Tun.PSC04-5.I4]|uniref:hypothetical protein n=1 Tax=Pseudovibrio sp. Tun.PSC04-5.I4 TaxID=1798213 RepID=UPI00088A82B0|nr:hypothetical protein [Pseudovibrio sp. Tun.PSC04-5.I4]SDR14818.1 hypothetical protein SAMN04515695_3018 [Pseudovibrio sp. Tun.PSC04-5.I4]